MGTFGEKTLQGQSWRVALVFLHVLQWAFAEFEGVTYAAWANSVQHLQCQILSPHCHWLHSGSIVTVLCTCCKRSCGAVLLAVSPGLSVRSWHWLVPSATCQPLLSQQGQLPRWSKMLIVNEKLILIYLLTREGNGEGWRWPWIQMLLVRKKTWILVQGCTTCRTCYITLLCTM